MKMTSVTWSKQIGGENGVITPTSISLNSRKSTKSSLPGLEKGRETASTQISLAESCLLLISKTAWVIGALLIRRNRLSTDILWEPSLSRRVMGRLVKTSMPTRKTQFVLTLRSKTCLANLSSLKSPWIQSGRGDLGVTLLSRALLTSVRLSLKWP